MVRGVVLGAVLLAALPQRPLPDANRFLAAARERLAGNALRQSQFIYRERVTELKLNPFGRLGTGPVEVFEVYPVPGDEEMTYKRLIERDGQRLSAAEIARQDREFAARYNAWRRRLAREGEDERAARLRKRAEAEQKDREQSAEVTALFTFTVERRDTLEGQPAIVVAFAPKPDAQPRSREARVAAAFSGRAWVHEHEHEVMRVEAEANNDVSFGWGLIARLHRGATAKFTRARILGAWLPVRSEFNGTGRALLFRTATFNFTREYFDYRPYDPAALTAILDASSRSNN